LEKEKELLLPVNTYQIDLVPLIGRPHKIKSG